MALKHQKMKKKNATFSQLIVLWNACRRTGEQ